MDDRPPSEGHEPPANTTGREPKGRGPKKARRTGNDGGAARTERREQRALEDLSDAELEDERARLQSLWSTRPNVKHRLDQVDRELGRRSRTELQEVVPVAETASAEEITDAETAATVPAEPEPTETTAAEATEPTSEPEAPELAPSDVVAPTRSTEPISEPAAKSEQVTQPETTPPAAPEAVASTSEPVVEGPARTEPAPTETIRPAEYPSEEQRMFRGILNEAMNPMASARVPGSVAEKLNSYLDRLHRGEARELTGDTETWGVLRHVFAERIAHGEQTPGVVLAHTEAYRRAMDRIPYSTDEHARSLGLITKTHSPAEALALFERLSERLNAEGAVVGKGKKERLASEVIAEAWYNGLRESIQSLEKKAKLPDDDDGRALLDLRRGLPKNVTPETLALAIDQAAAVIRGHERYREAERRHRTSVAGRREAYAKALKSRGRIFGRTSEAELEELRLDYEHALREEAQAEIDEIKRDFSGRERTDPTVEAEMNERLVQLVLGNKQEEQQALRQAMRDTPEKTAVQRFKQLWRQHAGLRLAVGIGLWGGTALSLAHGNVPAAAMLQAARAGLSGVGATMTTEATWELIRGKKGATRELSQDAIKALSDEDLERTLAAHTTRFADVGGPEFGVVQRGVVRKHVDQTGQLLEAELRRRQEGHIRQRLAEDKDAGRSADESIEAMILESADREHKQRETLERQRDADRRNSVRKWVTAGAIGTIVGGITGGLGLSRVREMAEAAEAKKSATQAAKAAAESSRAAIPDTAHTEAVMPDTTPVDTVGVETTPADTAVTTPAVAESVQTAPVDTVAVESTPAAPDTSSVESVPMAPDSAATGDTELRPLVQAESVPDSVQAAADTTRHAVADSTEQIARGATEQAVGDSARTATESTAGAAPGEFIGPMTATEAAEAAGRADYVEVAQKGDRVWKMATRVLTEKFGAQFSDLDEARKTYVIDAVKDRIAAHPDVFGLKDADHLALGQNVDFSSLFTGPDALPMDEVFGKAQDLSEQAVENILANNAQLESWVEAHPGEMLTSEQVNSILSGATEAGTHGNAAEAALDDGWARRLGDAARERFIERICVENPAQYVELHEQHPNLYPEIAGVTEAAPEVVARAQDVIEISGKSAKAFHDYQAAATAVRGSLPPDQAEKMLNYVGGLETTVAAKKGAVEHAVEMAGGKNDATKKIGKVIGKSLRALLKALPKDEIGPGQRVGGVIERLRAK